MTDLEWLRSIARRADIQARGAWPRRLFDRHSWFAREILVHEPQLRGYLRRFLRASYDLADAIQETYARLLSLPDQDLQRIRMPHAFLFTTARHVALEWRRRGQVVPDATGADPLLANIADERPSAYDELNGLQESALLASAIDTLPKRCREVLILRRIHGLTQKQIARRLGISENTVEKHAAKGVRQCTAYIDASL
jgi:RNA polymerase sigma-70 factor (ECF subfamily)